MARFGNVAHSVGEMAFTLSAQAADPRGRDASEHVDGQRQILKPGQPVQQAVGGDRVRSRLELPQPGIMADGFWQDSSTLTTNRHAKDDDSASQMSCSGNMFKPASLCGIDGAEQAMVKGWIALQAPMPQKYATVLSALAFPYLPVTRDAEDRQHV